MTSTKQLQFPCKQCGGNLVFEPGVNALKCPYCGTINEIAATNDDVRELDFNTFVNSLPPQELEDRVVVRCGTCGAETTLKPNVTSDRCPFCGAGIVAQASSKKSIKPQAVLPFHITHQQAAEAFKGWLATRWFAPSSLSRMAERNQIDGVYIPSWTYDSDTTTDYRGERGDDYWDTETYTTMEGGRSVTRTRQVRKTRWTHASGTVDVHFDDVLVIASNSLPKKNAAALEPWDLDQLLSYRDEYLSGFVSESYQIDLPQGFEAAKEIMSPTIRAAIERDIGGDHQRIHSADTTYNNVTFKHALLPIWISAYRFAARTFRFLVNARTGEVQGERPYSALKIFFTILAAIIVILIGIAIFHGR